VVRDARISGEIIDQRGLVDGHYSAVARRALHQEPAELSLPEAARAAFVRAFGCSWDEALAGGQVLNATDAAERLGLQPLVLGEKFQRLKPGKDMIQLGLGLVLGRLGGIYVVNGFYPSLRAKFTAPGSWVHYFEVEWDSADLTWEAFRFEVIGDSDPTKAFPGSIRKTIFQKWKSMGLNAKPNITDNGVHASASAFEALVEKAKWLGVPMSKDPFGKMLIAAGIKEEMLQEWGEDPSVMFRGKMQPVFSVFESLDMQPCLSVAVEMASAAT